MTLNYGANVIISCIDFSLNGKSPYHANKFGNIASEEFFLLFSIGHGQTKEGTYNDFLEIG